MRPIHPSRRSFLEACSLSSIALLLSSTPAKAISIPTRRPNIIYIVADDLGYADIGSYGGRNGKTPELDKLAAQAMAFTQAYANSCVCSPSRIAFITGRYPGRLAAGLEEPIATNGDTVGLPPSEPTLPSILRSNGYSTSLIGKWHMGEAPLFGPLKSGYDRFFGIHSGGTDYFKHEFELFGNKLGKLYENATPVERAGYLTDLLGDRAVSEIEMAAKSRSPLFLSLHFTAPHWPWEGPEDEARAELVKNPMDLFGGTLEIYAAMLRSMDANIGRVLQSLAASGMDENTIVIFASDNGGERFSDTWPLSGMKGELLEGGIRTPLLIRWPAKITHPSVSEEIVTLMDLVPTLLEVADAKVPEEIAFDGVSFADVLKNGKPMPSRNIFWRHKAFNQCAVREGEWKYLSINGNEHLFNVKIDPRERAEMKGLHPEIFNRLRKSFQSWNATMLPYTDENYSSKTVGAADRY